MDDEEIEELNFDEPEYDPDPELEERGSGVDFDELAAERRSELDEILDMHADSPDDCALVKEHKKRARSSARRLYRAGAWLLTG